MLQDDPLRLPPFHCDADPEPAFHLAADPDQDFPLTRIRIPRNTANEGHFIHFYYTYILFQPLESMSILELTERMKELNLRLMEKNRDGAGVAANRIIQQIDALKVFPSIFLSKSALFFSQFSL